MQFKRKIANELEMKNRVQNLSESLKISNPARFFFRKFPKILSDNKEEFSTQSVDTLDELVALGKENLLTSLDNPNYFGAEDYRSATVA